MANESKKIRVGVLSGGVSLEHEVSLNSGKTVKNNLDPGKYEVADIFVSKDGRWFLEGKEIVPQDLKGRVDIVFSVLHGSYGEDGQVQSILEKEGINFVGSATEPSRLSFSKVASKRVFEKSGIKTPRFLSLEKSKIGDLSVGARNVLKKFQGRKVVAKASESGSSFGVFICDSVEELAQALREIFEIGNEALVEEYIKGKEFTCGVLEQKVGQVEPLPIVEIIPQKEFFDFEAKYENAVEEICPAIIEDKNLVKEIQETAVKVHKALGLADYSRTDFIFNEEKGLYVLEVNTLPGMTETSLYPQELRAAGWKLSDFLDTIIRKNLDV